ncbi:hypothetical protein [Thiolinea disciformis]|uniref:hypothetical protein n=1 Tax=Thiolinea disciformis TaxID=125614 RepID=UPI00037CA692|nr:hypothetical protein [Thiolinea disciformis]
MTNGRDELAYQTLELMHAVREGLQAQTERLTAKELQALKNLREQALQGQSMTSLMAWRQKMGRFFTLPVRSRHYSLVSRLTFTVVTVIAVGWFLTQSKTIDGSEPVLPRAVEASGVAKDTMMTEDTEFLEHLEMYEWLATNV